MGNNELEIPNEETGESLSKDEIFSTLSNQRRRYVVHYLKHNPVDVRIRDLSEQIAAWENDITMPELTYKQRKRVYTSLHQTHLPKLDDCGIVSYDRDRGLISLASGAADLDIYLELAPDDDIPWSRVYLGLSGAALFLVAGAWGELLPASVSPLGYAALVALAFALTASAHSFKHWTSTQDDTQLFSDLTETVQTQTQTEESTGRSSREERVHVSKTNTTGDIPDPEPTRDSAILAAGADNSDD